MSADTTGFGRRGAGAASTPLARSDLSLGASGIFIILSFVVVAMLYEHWVWAEMLAKPMAPPAWILDRGNAWSADPAAIKRGWAPYWLVMGLAGLFGGGLGWTVARKGERLRFLPTLWRGVTTYIAVWLAAMLPLKLSTPLFGAPSIDPGRVLLGAIDGVLNGVGAAVIELGFGGLFVILPVLLLWIGLTTLIANRLVPRRNG